MKTSRILAALILLATVIVIQYRGVSTSQAQVTRTQPAPPAGELQAITLTFGSKDVEPTAWDGSASISSGSIERIAGLHFTDEHSISGNSWKCGTYQWGAFSGGMHPNEKPQPQPTPLQTCGVTLYLRAPADAVVTVKVPKGEFSFRPMDVPEIDGLFPLAATIEITRSAVSENATTAEYEDDLPSLAADGNKLWLSWVAYKNQADTVYLKSYENGSWTPPVTITEKPADVFMTAVAVSNGKPMVVWAERAENGYQLKARSPGGPVETLTPTAGNHIFHRVASDAKGNVHVAWQSLRNSRHADIYLKSYTGGRWGNEINLSDQQRHARANDWAPAVVADKDGTVWVAWDSYASGAYNVMLRSVRDGRPGPLVKVTDSPRFHTSPSLAVDNQNRVWIAWDESRENWGKDTGFLLGGGTGLYDSRRIVTAIYEKGRWLAPLQQIEDVVPYGIRRFTQQPRLISDAQGRMWMFLRPRSNTKLPTTLWAAGGKWEAFAAYYTGDRWSDLIIVPEAVGRNSAEISVAADQRGNVYAALGTDNRLYGGPNFSYAPRNHDIILTRVKSLLPAKGLDAGARGTEPPATKPTEPREREQIAALRAQTISAGGKSLKIYRGDMHRHTEISLDGAGDGTLFESYRYAMDAAGMDYLAVTDHQSGHVNAQSSDYQWWRIQKSADMFHNPGFFTGLYGTERSLGYPNGHRNLIFAKRGVPILHITPAEQKSSTGPYLYPFLRKWNGIATSHTSHTSMGTDWRDNDPDLEPIVEIFQGARTSAEQEGAPLAPTGTRTELWAGNYRPLGFVANAWAKGYKLGVQASSDHVSTHLSYAFILAENETREALLDAMRKRQTYAATSNILLDYRASVNGRQYMQGDIAGATGSLPELTAKITGTSTLKEVVVVRDNKVIYSQQPPGETYDLRFRETALPPGEHFYYVRVEQQDGNVAWSSPIWVTKN